MKAGCFLVGMLLVVGCATAQAEITVSGDTTLRYEYYQVSGDETQAPYVETGGQFYQDLNLRMAGEPEAGRYWEFNTSAVLNRSDYRHPDRGLVPEWMHLRYEDGTVPLPYRLDVGDQMARLTPLTLNQRIQAARVELQPQSEGPVGGRHSLVWISGRDRSDWNSLDPSAPPRFHDTAYHGASWLLDGAGPGRYSVNVLHQSPGDHSPDAADALIASLAAAWDVRFAQQRLAAEAELAQVDERHDVRTDSDQGLRIAISGEADGAPLDYGMRYRRYGDGFRPLGTEVTPDSRLIGIDAGLAIPLGMHLSGSLERHTDAVTRQRLELEDYGLVLSAPDSLGMLDWMDHEWGVRIRDRENRSGSIRDRATEARWTIRVAGGERSQTRMSMRWLGTDDDTPLDRDRRERRLALSHQERFMLGGLNVSATPGVDYRHRTGHLPMTLIHPTLRLDAGLQAHRFGMLLGYRTLERRDHLLDVDEYSLRLDYRYRLHSHVFGLEFDQQLREPEDGNNTESWRAGMFWRYEFSGAGGLSLAD